MKKAIPDKIIPDTTVRVRVYSILGERIENAIELGYKRAHKHTDTPSNDVIIDCIHIEVMGAIGSILQFPDADDC